MDARERERLYAWAVSRPASWYIHHPNADKATARILETIGVTATLTDNRVRRFRVTLGCPLTVRQLQVLGGKASGLTSERTADLLGVSVYTVRHHLKGAYARLCVKDPTEAVAVAMRCGWL